MSRRLLAAAATIALTGCLGVGTAPPVGPRSCPDLVTPVARAGIERPPAPGVTLRALLHWQVDMAAYADAMERQARAREEQIRRHNAGL